MMVFGHSHTGPVHGGRNSSRRELRAVQTIRAPHTKWTEQRGPDTGMGASGVFSPNATRISDLKDSFDTQNVSVGCGPSGSVEYSAGSNENGDAIDVISVSPPFRGHRLWRGVLAHEDMELYADPLVPVPERTDRMRVDRGTPLRLHLDIAPAVAMSRLVSRVERPGPVAGVTGDFARSGFVGEFGETAFHIRSRSPVPRYYALHAFGHITGDGRGSIVTVDFRRQQWASIALWTLRVVWLVLLLGAIYSATQQQVFLPAVFFVGIFGGIFIWSTRARSSDRERLSRFIVELFPQSMSN